MLPFLCQCEAMSNAAQARCCSSKSSPSVCVIAVYLFRVLGAKSLLISYVSTSTRWRGLALQQPDLSPEKYTC